MITVERTFDPQYLESCMQGEGIRRRCWGGFKPQEFDYKDMAANGSLVFLKVSDNGHPRGFILFVSKNRDTMEIHFCLKTIGRKTREATRAALAYVASFGIKRIEVFYPSSHRGMNRLMQEFQFTPEPHSEFTPIPYTKQSLTLT